MNNIAVIFDMDGVILDSERIYQEIERSMYNELSIHVSIEEHMSFMGTAEGAMWAYICEKYNVKRPVEELIGEERERFMEKLEGPGIPLIDGLVPLLESLRAEQIPCWIASSSSSDIIARVIRINGLDAYYQGYVSGDDVTESKPSPEIFLKAAELASTDPSNCLVIEDSENGIRAAKSAGMAVIALRHPESADLNLSMADLTIGGLNDFFPEGLKVIQR